MCARIFCETMKKINFVLLPLVLGVFVCRGNLFFLSLFFFELMEFNKEPANAKSGAKIKLVSIKF